MPFPFQGTVISNYKSSASNSISSFEVYTKIGIALRIISNIVLPFTPATRVGAFGIDKAFSHLTLAGVQASEKYVMSRMAIKYMQRSRRTVLPFLNFDSFEKNRYNPGCNPTISMLVSEVDCDFVVNYGDNALGLAIILFFMILVDIAYFFLSKRLGSTPAVKSIPFFVLTALKTFGLRFFLAKMEGVMLEALFYSFVNFYTGNSTNAAGIVISTIFLVYFLLQISYCIYLCQFITAGMKKASERKESTEARTDKINLDEIVEKSTNGEKGYLWRAGSLMWAGMRPNLGPSGVYYPIVSMIRILVLGLVVGLLTEIPILMALHVMAVDIVFLLYVHSSTKWSPRSTLLGNVIDLASPVFNIIYYFFALISTAEGAQESYSYDAFLFVLLLIYILFYLIAVTISIVATLIAFTKWILSKSPSSQYSTSKYRTDTAGTPLGTEFYPPSPEGAVPLKNDGQRETNQMPVIHYNPMQVVDYKGIYSKSNTQQEDQPIINDSPYLSDHSTPFKPM